jgi:hypothetical protein
MNKSIHVQFLYSQGCSNASPAIDLIEKVGNEIGLLIAVEPVLVTSPFQLQGLGSPSRPGQRTNLPNYPPSYSRDLGHQADGPFRSNSCYILLKIRTAQPCILINRS